VTPNPPAHSARSAATVQDPDVYDYRGRPERIRRSQVDLCGICHLVILDRWAAVVIDNRGTTVHAACRPGVSNSTVNLAVRNRTPEPDEPAVREALASQLANGAER
jgi:hypothetical protein